MKTKKMPTRQVLAGLLAAACCGSALPALATCDRVPIPGLTVVGGSFEHAVSDAGRVALTGRSSDMPADVLEVYLFDPGTAALTRLTSGSSPFGPGRSAQNGGTQSVRAISADGSEIFVTYFGGISFNFNPATGSQSPVLYTRGERSYIIDTATGTRTDVPSPIADAAEAAGASFSSTIESTSEDGRYLLMADSSLSSTGVIGGDLYRYDRETGARLSIGPLLAAASPTFQTTQIPTLSGDGQRVLLTGDDGRLLTPNRLPTPANVYRLIDEAYVLDLETGTLTRALDIDISQPRNGGTSAGLVRNLGRDGFLIVTSRPAPFVTVPNPDRQGFVGVARLGDPIRPIVGPETWLRGRFGTNYAYLSDDDRFVYFASADDLVGENPQLSDQLYSIELATGVIRQITDQDDLLGRLVALGFGPTFFNDELFTTGQTIFAGASADHSIVAVRVTGQAIGTEGNVVATRAGNSTRLTQRGSATANQAGYGPLPGHYTHVYRCAD